jgi:hypothetical protein
VYLELKDGTKEVWDAKLQTFEYRYSTASPGGVNVNIESTAGGRKKWFKCTLSVRLAVLITLDR